MLETLILGVIAALLFFKLFSVLGKRTGNERPQPGRFEQAPPSPAHSGNVIPLADRKGSMAPPLMPGQTIDQPRSVADGLAEIRQADASFDEGVFLQGARSAFGMIVSAFAAGDAAALRPLLADAVFSKFSAAIAERQRNGRTLETSIVSYEDVDLAEARLDGRDALVTVRFTTRQTNVIRADDGTILDGGGPPEEVVDLWSFTRDTRSRDPNWVLVATRTP